MFGEIAFTVLAGIGSAGVNAYLKTERFIQDQQFIQASIFRIRAYHSPTELDKIVQKRDIANIKKIFSGENSTTSLDFTKVFPLHTLACKVCDHATKDIEGAEIATFLISCGFDPSAYDSYGFTPLHYAAAALNVEVMEALIQGGADVNARYKPTKKQAKTYKQAIPGETPLHLAVRTPFLESDFYYRTIDHVYTLMKAEAIIFIEDATATSPHDVTCEDSNKYPYYDILQCFYWITFGMHSFYNDPLDNQWGNNHLPKEREVESNFVYGSIDYKTKNDTYILPHHVILQQVYFAAITCPTIVKPIKESLRELAENNPEYLDTPLRDANFKKYSKDDYKMLQRLNLPLAPDQCKLTAKAMLAAKQKNNLCKLYNCTFNFH